MVWGMSLPSSFGDFWPEGRFESDPQQPLSHGWRDRLIEYFLSQTPEVQNQLYDYRGDDGLAAHRYPSYVCSKFVMEQGVALNAETPPINSIKPHECPQYYQTQKNQKNLASLIELSDRIIAVDERLKSIIGKIEPGVHQFFPIEIRMRQGAVYPISYYILVIENYQDSFCPKESEAGAINKWEGYDLYTHHDTKKGVSGLAFDGSKFGGAHLWRERRFTSLLTCFSDELMFEVAEAELRIPKHYKMMEV